MRCVGAVLAGGASRRMGADKAFIEIEGLTMVERAAVALRDAGIPVVLVVGGDRARLEPLGLPFWPDLYPGQGPLGAIVTALHALDRAAGPSAEAVVTLPCDVVEPDAASVRAVLGRIGAAAPAIDGVVPVGDGMPQWLHAAWRRRGRLLLSEAFGRGLRAPKEAASLLNTVALDVPGTRWFRDADYPEDLPQGALRHRD